ncbi:MAG: helix-turn-helix domain-containing protein [Clostridia bacterium]|nr:helix-turn-helix domain-containing protein [Clostridia bacterium]
MPIDTTRTGAAIAACRQRMNLSQQGLAGLMNVTHQAVSKWEKGLALPDTETLLALAKLFGTTMEDLLTGKLPKEPEAIEENVSAEETASAQESTEGEPAAIPADELGELDFSSVMNMLPFVSTKVADHLFLSCAKNAQMDASALLSIAPFVSTRTLADYVSAHSFKTESPEVVASLAPFLPTKVVDDMVLSMEAPLPPHAVQMLMPFASTRVVDQMVMGKLGIPTEPDEDHPGDFSRKNQDKIHAKIQQKLNALEKKSAAPKRESPRMHMIRTAIEKGYYDLLAECFDELDDDTYRMLLNELTETGDARLLDLFCEYTGEMDANLQFDFAQFLLKGKMYTQLAEAIEEMDEDVQHCLLDKAFEMNDPELFRLLKEHI